MYHRPTHTQINLNGENNK